MQQSYRFIYLIYLCSLLLVQTVFSSEKKSNTRESVNKVNRLIDSAQTLANANNWSYWISGNGRMGFNPNIDGTGSSYPRGTVSLIYSDGLVWGAKVNGSLKLGGQNYSEGTTMASDHVYRIRSDWSEMNDEVLGLEASEIYSIKSNEVTIEMKLEIWNQYRSDWQNWPVDQGAPFVDSDQNGVYNPVNDDDGLPVAALGDYPGIVGAAQVIWFKTRETDVLKNQQVFFTDPLGIEAEYTIWSFKQPNAALDQTIFKKYRLTNTSSDTLKEMYVGQFSDVDLGDNNDDYTGCDSVLSAGYVYNSDHIDPYFKYIFIAPAVGYLLLDGPADDILATDPIPPMTSYNYARPPEQEPFVTYDLKPWLQYNWLRGRINDGSIEGAPNKHCDTGLETLYPLNGDPVSGSGDIQSKCADGAFYDQKYIVSSGPFEMLPGESREMVVALVGGVGTTHLESLTQLKLNMHSIKNFYNSGSAFPIASTEIEFSNPGLINLKGQAELTGLSGVTECRIDFSPQLGEEAPFTVNLYDDGSHGDFLAGDQIWANTQEISYRKYPFNGTLVLNQGQDTTWYRSYFAGICLRPAPVITNWSIVWESGKQDRAMNHNEEIHTSFNIYNPDDALAVSDLKILTGDGLLHFTDLQPDETRADDSLRMKIFAPSEGDSIDIRLSLIFDHHRLNEKITMPFKRWYKSEGSGTTMDITYLKGAPGSFKAVVAEPARMTGHEYLVTFSRDEQNQKYMQVTDLEKNSMIISGAYQTSGFPDPFPVADGIVFQYLPDNLDFDLIAVVANASGLLSEFAYCTLQRKGSAWPDRIIPMQVNGSRWMLHILSSPETEGTYDYFLHGLSDTERGMSAVLPYDYEIRFTSGQSFGFIPYAYADSSSTGGTLIEINFELWNIGINTPGDPSDDFRLFPYIKDIDQNLAFNLTSIDHILSGSTNDPQTDGICWIEPADRSAGEIGYNQILNAIQSDPENFSYLGELTAGDELMMDMVFFNHNGGDVSAPDFPQNTTAQMLEPGTIIRMNTWKPILPGDSIKIAGFSVFKIDSASTDYYVLEQNFPNPFNPVTTIRYRIKNRTQVQLEIYNLLGQKVRVLIDEQQDVGLYSYNFSADGLSSGVYFYRLKAGSGSIIKKMLILK